MKLVVTGGSSGLGRALLDRLVDHQVWNLDVSQPEVILEHHHFVATDLSTESAIQKSASTLPSEIDGLINVAGIARAADPAVVVAVNFLGLRCITELLAKRLITGGRIVNVSSTAGSDWARKYEQLKPLLETESYEQGLEWCKENEKMISRDPYTFSKRLVTAYTKRLAYQGVHNGFTANCISPGPIETPLFADFESLMGKEQIEWAKSQTLRIAKPDDIAEVLGLLSTGDARWLNGVDVPVDGGYTSGMEAGWIDFSQSPVMKNKG